MHKGTASVGAHALRGSNVTIADVARHAGVSAMTVSRVINGTQVRHESKERVERAISDLSYKPNSAARALAGAKRTNIVIIYEDESNGYINDIVIGAIQRASIMNVGITVDKWSKENENTREIINYVAGLAASGVIIIPPICQNVQLISLLKKNSVVPVAVATYWIPSLTSIINVNERTGAQAITDHLLTLGHRRIAFVRDSVRGPVCINRENGYREALCRAGVEVDERLFCDGSHTYGEAMASASRIFSLSDPPSAVVVTGAMVAAAMVAVGNKGDVDPKKFLVCAFDDFQFQKGWSTGVLSIRQPLHDMASAAVDLIVRQSNTGIKIEHIKFNYELYSFRSEF